MAKDKLIKSIAPRGQDRYLVGEVERFGDNQTFKAIHADSPKDACTIWSEDAYLYHEETQVEVIAPKGTSVIYIIYTEEKDGAA
jgi:hypothetical protein